MAPVSFLASSICLFGHMYTHKVNSTSLPLFTSFHHVNTFCFSGRAGPSHISPSSRCAVVGCGHQGVIRGEYTEHNPPAGLKHAPPVKSLSFYRPRLLSGDFLSRALLAAVASPTHPSYPYGTHHIVFHTQATAPRTPRALRRR